MGKIFGFLAKAGSMLTGGAVLASGAAATENYVNGENSLSRRFLRESFAGVATSQKDAGVESAFHGFYKFIEQIAQMIQRSFGTEGPISNAMGNWAQRNMGRPETFGNGDVDDTTTPKKSVSVGQAPDVTQSASLDGGDALGLAAGASGFAIARTLGVRAIPVVASFAAAADGIWDTAAYALKGEFGNAATRFSGGVIETAAGVGGVFTYAAGVTAREVVENASNANFGTNVPDGEIAHVAKAAVNWLTNDR